MKILILYPDTTPMENNAFDWYREAFAKHGFEVEIRFFAEGEHIKKSCDAELLDTDLPDAVLMRGYNSQLSRYFEDRGVRVVNSTASMELSRNKVATHQILESVGLPTPRYMCHSRKYVDEGHFDGLYLGDNQRGVSYREVADYFSCGRFVVKQISGSKGEGVFLVEDEMQFDKALTWCANHGTIAFFQEFVSSSIGRDMRVWVVGDKVVGNVMRYNEHSFKSNFAQGGSAVACELPEGVAALAVAATRAIGLDFAGVDLLFDEHGTSRYGKFTVCEVNGNAGFRTLSLVQHSDGGYDIPDALAAFFRKL